MARDHGDAISRNGIQIPQFHFPKSSILVLFETPRALIDALACSSMTIIT